MHSETNSLIRIFSCFRKYFERCDLMKSTCWFWLEEMILNHLHTFATLLQCDESNSLISNQSWLFQNIKINTRTLFCIFSLFIDSFTTASKLTYPYNKIRIFFWYFKKVYNYMPLNYHSVQQVWTPPPSIDNPLCGHYPFFLNTLLLTTFFCQYHPNELRSKK